MHPLLPIAGIVTAVVAFAAVIAHDYSDKPVSAARPIEVAGIQYNVQGARVLDLNGDEPVIRALPPSQRRASGRQVVYGVFITLTNSGARTRPMSRQFTLIDDNQHTFRPIPLRRDSPFAYRPGDLAGGRVSPASDSAPAQDFAEQGYPLVFRIPRRETREGLLLLRVFDPTAATPPADTIVQSP